MSTPQPKELEVGQPLFIVAHLILDEHGVQAPAAIHKDHQLFSSAKADPCEACHADITGFQSSHPRCHAVFGNHCATQGNTKLGLGIPVVALETTQQLTLDRLHAGNMIRWKLLQPPFGSGTRETTGFSAL